MSSDYRHRIDLVNKILRSYFRVKGFTFAEAYRKTLTEVLMSIPLSPIASRKGNLSELQQRSWPNNLHFVSGSNILETLKYNRETLKGAHRRIIDLANTLGLSNATISLIERRVSQDKYVLFGGMFVTLAVITLVIMYLT